VDTLIFSRDDIRRFVAHSRDSWRATWAWRIVCCALEFFFDMKIAKKIIARVTHRQPTTMKATPRK